MKLKMTLRWVMVFGVLLLMTQVNAGERPALKTQKDMVSYGIGVDVARNFMRLGIEIDLEVLIKGLRDGLSGEKLLVNEADLRAAMNTYQTELKERMQQAMKVAMEENKRKGDAFLAENRTKEGVVTLPSGLQYRILMAGDGKKPTDADMVECNYRGTLIDGTEFDSSYRTGKPATFKVTGLIAGWTEALKIMPVGSRWQLFIPPQLAYGERGASGAIGPNATLIFELELLSIK
jgi:FKBP-type peptidyl-prolyl cis-trans isomerase